MNTQNNTTDTQKAELKLSEKTWFHVSMMVFLWPVGIYLIWKTKRYSNWVRTGIVVGFVLLFFIGLLAPKVPKKGENGSAPYNFGHTQMSGLLSQAKRDPGPPGVVDFIAFCKQENSSVKGYSSVQLEEWEKGIWAGYSDWVISNAKNSR